jgi:trk system potassium uptake protein TrkA
MKSFVVIGLGRFGGAVAQTLGNNSKSLLLIDKNESHVSEFMDIATDAVTADASDERVLRELDIRDYDVAVVAIGENIQASALITMMLKEMGVNIVIAKAVNEQHAKLLNKVGADRVVRPEAEMGRRIAEGLLFENFADLLDLGDEVHFTEYRVMNERYIGKSLSELDALRDLNLTIPFVHHNNGTSEIGTGDTILQRGDIAYLLGHVEDVLKFVQ